MGLLSEIQDAATSSHVAIGDLLRRCKILAYRVNSQELNLWVEKELDGYGSGDQLPDYRIIEHVPIKADRINAFWHQTGLSVPLMALPEWARKNWGHRHIRQSAISLDELLKAEPNDNFYPEFPADIVALIRHDAPQLEDVSRLYHVLARASIVHIVEAVRNNILGFTLDIERENPQAGDVPGNTPSVEPERVNQIFNQNFNGPVGNVATGSHDFDQSATINQTWQHADIDLVALAAELPKLRQALAVEAIEPEQFEAVAAVRRAEIEAEKKDTPKLLGNLKAAGKWAFDKASEIGTDVAAEALKKALWG